MYMLDSKQSSGLSEIVEEEHLRFEPTIAPANSAITTPSLPLSPTNFQHRRGSAFAGPSLEKFFSFIDIM
jgi:hypothetical protein